jgi:5-methylcytosine-specific restriction endonuclease McrA
MAPRFGHTTSQATKDKIRQALLGRKLPPEVIAKMSAAAMGKTPSLETRTKLRVAHLGNKNHFFGKTHTAEARDKIRLGHLGITMPPRTIEHRRNLSEAQKRRHSGITLKHPDKSIRMSLEYRLWRESVFKRDDYRCYDCGTRGSYLEAHHIFPFATFPRLRFLIENGITLCRPCHKKYSKGPNVLKPQNQFAVAA